ncbi:phage tail tape measure protein [Neobacillus sp. NPDC093127]|uniref:phage tail tape measure protein n=1 Tax=Neobacillus sp. NPDC093127 TaxID=3364296 RepID=UPI0038281AC9
MEIPGLVVRIGADISNLTSGLRNATSQLGNFTRAQEKGFQALGTIGKVVTGFGVATAGGLGLAVKTAADFEQQMSKVKAISGATGKDFDNLTSTAKKLGATTAWTAKQAGEGMEYLALAGWKTNDIIAAMPGMLDLASAGSLDLGRAADITSDTMQAFGISAKDATHAADVFAYAQANANTNVEQLGEALKYSAPVAHALGWTLEETAAASMAMANSGLKGSIAGQAFASSMARLAKPTKKMQKVIKETGIAFFDAQGNMKSMPDLVAEIEKGTKGMTMQQRSATLSILFGAEAYKHWAILLGTGSEKLRSMTDDLHHADGAASKMAKTMLDNLNGQLILLKSSIEGAAISIGNALIPMLRTMTKFINKVVDGFNSLSDRTKNFIAIGSALAAAFMLVVGPMLIMIGFIPSIISGFGAIATMVGMTSGALLRLILVTGGWVTVIMLVIGALILAYQKCEWFRNAVDSSWAWIVKATKATGEWIKSAFGTAVDWTVQKISQIKPAVIAIGGWFSDAFNGAVSAVSSFFSGLSEKFGFVGKLVDYIKDSFSSVENVIATLAPLVTRLALGFLGISGPVGWIIGLVVSLGATLFKLSKDNESVRAALSSVWNGLKTVFESVMSAIQPIIDAFAQAFVDLAPQFAQTGKVIGDSLASLGPTFAQLGQAFGGLLGAIFELIPSLLEVGKTVFNLYIDFLPQLLNIAVQVFQGIFTIIKTVVPVIINLIKTIVPIIVMIITTVLPTLLKVVASVFQMIVSVIVAVMPVIIGLIQAIIPVILQIVQTVLPLLLSIIQAVFPVILAIIQAVLPVVIAIINIAADIITNVLVPAIGFILTIVQAVFPVIVQIIDAAMKIVMGIIQVVTGIIKGDWSTVWNGIKSILSGVWDAIKAIVVGAINIVKTIISGAWTFIKSSTQTAWNAVKSLFSSVLSGIVNIITSQFNAMKSIVKSVTDSIKGVIETGWNSAVNFLKSIDLMEIGKNIIQGLIKGISSMVGAVKDAVTGIGKKIKNGFTDFFSIKSPSRLMISLAKHIPGGIIKGIDGMQNKVVAAANRMSGWMTPDIPNVSMAYSTPSGSYATLDSAINGSVDISSSENNQLLKEVVAELRRQKNMIVEMDSRIVGKMVEKTVTRQQDFKTKRTQYFDS